VKLVQIRNNGSIKPNRWKHSKDEQLSTEQLSNGYTKASGMKENNDSSLESYTQQWKSGVWCLAPRIH